MSLTIYNSLSHTKEKFQPVHKNKVNMYVCGMTVYSDTHIGHARTYLAFDVIRRYFEYKGFDVTYIQNITDVDDKIIAAAQRESKDPLEYSKTFADRCLQDLDALGIRRADHYPKASETIDDMITMTQQLIEKGIAYEAEGDVYFSVERFPEYGKLSNQNIKDMKAGARIQPGENKKNPLDFALWKRAKPGEPSWDSPWGKGRPGWHIECSAMSSKYLGLPFDIHGGGRDLQFPHHENEIAQAEAATGKPFARFWMHSGLLTINGEKMSKSLGNIVNVRDLIQHRKPEVIRLFFAQAHYRSPPDFSDKALNDVEKGLDRLYRFKEKLEHRIDQQSDDQQKALSDDEQQFKKEIILFEQRFVEAMDDDFNTPQAVATMFEFVSTGNKFMEDHSQANIDVLQQALKVFETIGQVLTLFQGETNASVDASVIVQLQNLMQTYEVKDNIPPELDQLIHALLQRRQQAREKKQWDVADGIRDALQNLGFEIQDTDQGPVWRKT